MLLIIDQSLATGFIPFNTRQQRASLSYNPGGSVLERKVYNNDNITFFSVLTFAKLRGSGCNTLSHSGSTSVNTRKRKFNSLIDLKKIAERTGRETF